MTESQGDAPPNLDTYPERTLELVDGNVGGWTAIARFENAILGAKVHVYVTRLWANPSPSLHPTKPQEPPRASRSCGGIC